MPRRPQPDTRRGLLRAGIAMLAVLVLLIAAIAIVSSLTAPTAHAPTVIPTPAAVRTPVRPAATAGATSPAGKHATAAPTSKSGHTVQPSDLIRRVAASHSHVAYFTGTGDAYTGRTLNVRTRASRVAITVGRADPFITPVWSPDGRSVLYGRVTETRATPGAEWTLLRFDTFTRTSSVLARMPGMDMIPLGWSQGRVLFALARATDTSVYVAGRQPRFLTILLPQVISGASLSPDGRFIAALAPASCGWCTLDIFDLSTLTVWNGPTGAPDEADTLWAGGHTLVMPTSAGLTAIDAASHSSSDYHFPAGLPLHWTSPLAAGVTKTSIAITDLRTGRVYSAAPRT